MDFYGVELTNSHTWRRLTTELADRSSPLSVYVRHRSPDTNPLESEYLASHPARVLVEPVGDRRWRQELGNAWEFVVQSSLWGRVSYSVQRKLEIEDSRLIAPIVEYLEHHPPQAHGSVSGAGWFMLDIGPGKCFRANGHPPVGLAFRGMKIGSCGGDWALEPYSESFRAKTGWPAGAGPSATCEVLAEQLATAQADKHMRTSWMPKFESHGTPAREVDSGHLLHATADS